MQLKNKIFFGIIFLLNLTVLILYITQKDSLALEKANLEKREENYKQIVSYLNKKFNTEGKYIWETNLLDKKSFRSIFPKKSVKMSKIFLWFDTSGCEKCYVYHMRSIKELIGRKNSIIIYNNKFKYLKADFRGYPFINNTGENNNFNDIVMLVNSDGRVLYADFPTSGLYNLSKKFYEIASNYLRK